MKFEGLLPCSRKPITRPYPEPDESDSFIMYDMFLNCNALDC
jgi:hypothetical protein